jgi:cell division protein FtsQ
MPRTEAPTPSLWRRSGAFLQEHFRSVTGLLLLALMGAMLVQGVHLLQDPYRFPLRVVKISSKLHRLEKADLQQAIAPYLHAGFFTVNVSRIHDAIEALPWVYRATVQRDWPDSLIVSFVEQEPVAHWGKAALLNRYGEIFVPRRIPGDLELPRLSGPQDHERAVLAQYRECAREFSPLGLRVTRVELNERRAWRIGLNNDVQLELGRSDTAQRLARFVRAFPHVFAGHLDQLRSVDMRYSNGFSVYWQQAGTGERGSKGLRG